MLHELLYVIMSGVGPCSVVVTILLVLVVGVPVSRADDNSTNPSGSDLNTTKTVVAVPCVTVVLVAAVAVSSGASIALVWRRRHRRNAPVFLGSCRRINTIHTETVNEGLQALERARSKHTRTNYSSPSKQHREKEEEEEKRGEVSARGQGRSAVAPALRIFSQLSSQRETSQDWNRGHQNSYERGDMHNSYGELTCALSLSRTYTCPNVQMFPVDLNNRHFSTGSSAPCFQPLPLANKGIEIGEMCPPLPVVDVGANESPRYMHLSPLTMEEPSQYESLAKARAGGGGRGDEGKGGVGGERKGMMGLAVTANLPGKSRKKPPPKLVAGKDRSPRAKQSVDGQSHSLPIPTERGSVGDSQKPE